MAEEKYYSVAEVADMFGLNKVTVRKWIREQKLSVLIVGGAVGWRIPQATVDALESRMTRQVA